MKKTFLLLCVGVTSLCKAQQKEYELSAHIRNPSITLYMTFAPGVGIPGINSEIEPAPLMEQITLPLRFRHNWFLIPEAYGGAFRTSKFPRKIGGLFPIYPRARHRMYGIRFGRSFAPPDNGFSILPSIGLDYMQINEPYQIEPGSALFRDIGYNIYRLYAIPIQVDLRFQKKRESYAAFAIGMRYNKNSRHSFGSLTAGIEFKLN